MFGRYLYCFVKFFHLQGFEVCFPRSDRLIAQLGAHKYSSPMLRQSLVRFCDPPLATSSTIVLPPLDPNYFRDLLSPRSDAECYHVPISQHPWMYYHGYWNEDWGGEGEGTRKHSIFMSGNFDPRYYGELGKEGVFKITSRLDLLNLVRRSRFYFPTADLPSVYRFVEGKEDKRILLVDPSVGMIPMKHLRRMLSRFAFVFAAPGIYMPFAHNVTEAMSVGSIPFIEASYAALFRPKLEHMVNAYVFECAEQLEDATDALFALSREQILTMKANVLDYHDRYLTPAAVVDRLVTEKHDKIYLQAERASVKLWRQENEGGVTGHGTCP